MTPAQVAHIMSLVRKIIDHTACKEAAEALAAYTELEAALRDAPQQAEIDAITELNHAQWLALENVRHLAARNRNEEWAQHMLRWCTEAGNAARILRTPSAPTAVNPTGEEVSAVEPDEPLDMMKVIHDGFALFKYAQGTKECIAFNRGVRYAEQARASKGTI